MATVGKNIRLFRSEAKINQATLAERLHVTPQTVSSWETGRTRPDVDTLENISSALGVDLIELIYGRQPKEVKPFMKYQKKYIVWTAVLGVLAIINFILLMPWFGQWLSRLFWHNSVALSNFKMVWSYLVPYVFKPLMFAAIGALIPAAISLWKDIRIKNRWASLALTIVPVAYLLVFAVGVAAMMSPLWFLSGAIITMPGIFIVIGAMACLGLNR